MSNLLVRSLFASALVLGAISCSEESATRNVYPTNAGAGAGGAALGNAGAGSMAGASGSPMGNTANVANQNGGAGGMGGAFGIPSGMAGGSGLAGAGGSLPSDAGASLSVADSGFDAGLSSDSGVVAATKLVALTFDDGPNNALTGAVLDKLEAHQVPASFFLIGQNVNAGTAAVMARAVALGCDLENHSAAYVSLTNQTPQQVADSVDSTTAAIEQFTTDSPEFFRPPNLVTDNTMFQAIALPFAGGIVGGDFPGGNPTVQAVADTVLNNVVDGSIILLHDVQPDLNPQPTPAALDIIVPTLKLQGYEFVTLRQLFTRRGVNPNSLQNDVWQSVPPTN